MNKFKYVFVGVSALLASTYAFAAFTPIAGGKTTYRARATTSGVATVSYSASIKNNNDTLGADQTEIVWAPVDPSALGTAPWRLASRLIKINSTITNLQGGIQLVTDNKAADASPRFIDLTPALSSNTDSNPAGLVLATGTASNYTLPMAWSIKPSSLTAPAQIDATDPNSGPLTGVANRFQWLYVVDKNSKAIDLNGDGLLNNTPVIINGSPITDSTDFVDGQDFSTILDARGIHFGQDTGEFGGGPGTKTSYIYLEADFATALPGVSYQTSKLTLESFTE